MKIYTKTGDAGDTALFGGVRVSKDDPRVRVYGTVDELNAALGVAAATFPSGKRDLIQQLQADLFVMGAELAAAEGKQAKLPLRLIDETDIARLEQCIDEHEASLPALANFILPGGSPGAAQLHVARAVCRRAEREYFGARRVTNLRNELGVFLNRLGDLLFVLARVANQDNSVPDIPWNPRGT